MSGFTILALSVTGAGKPAAQLTFRAGLNVVAGASNTGKTYIFQVLNFMLGSSRTPKPVREGSGYTHASLELVTRRSDHVTIQRALAGGEAYLYPVPLEAIDGSITPRRLAAAHSAGSADTISGQLLAFTDLYGRELRKNDRGEKQSLSFRNLAFLTLIDEERIITDRSPALSGTPTNKTVEQMTFGLLLTGTDDAAIIEQEKPADRKARLATEIDLLSRLLSDRESQFDALGFGSDSLVERQAQVRRALHDAGQVIATTQSEIDETSRTRDAAWTELREVDSRRRFLSEQAKRLRLLREHYVSDSSRLRSSLEAGQMFAQLPSGVCPVCGNVPTDAENTTTDTRLEEFQVACQAEIHKITGLLRGLDESLTVLQGEDKELGQRERGLRVALEEANLAIAVLLGPRVEAASANLSQLLKVDEQLVEGLSIAKDVLDLRTRHASAQQLFAMKVPKLKIDKKVETHTASRFCEVVAETLKAWKFPFEGTVSFDAGRFDLVLGDQNRGSLGKGYRAVAHAAFTVALMRYCRLLGIPHPGVVVLDTPLNPFKGPDRDISDQVNQDVQDAFYADLAGDKSGDQVIVLENTEPPKRLLSQMNYTHFSGNSASPRPGFFPG